MKKVLLAAVFFTALAGGGSRAAAADPGGANGLSLAPGLSFVDDSSSNFPIRGERLGEVEIARNAPTIAFFGTSHCWNTNREAERLVAFYAKHRDEARFLIVDLNHPTRPQKKLVDAYYHGYIPTLAVFDAKGNLVYDKAGETASSRGDTSGLEEIFKKVR